MYMYIYMLFNICICNIICIRHMDMIRDSPPQRSDPLESSVKACLGFLSVRCEINITFTLSTPAKSHIADRRSMRWAYIRTCIDTYKPMP